MLGPYTYEMHEFSLYCPTMLCGF